MSATAGSKRPATTPFASPSKAASKKSRTQYDYGDEDDMEASPDDQWSAADTDSMMWDDEDENAEIDMTRTSGESASISSDDGAEFMECEVRSPKDLQTTGVGIRKSRSLRAAVPLY
ncbi:unnamed protein product [Discula destructiva]